MKSVAFMHPEKLTKSLKSASRDLGFDLTAATPAVAPTGAGYLTGWIEAGYAGEMLYISERKDAYAHPRYVMDGVVSLLVLGMNYQTVAPADSSPGKGRIARYAWGKTDYHDLVHQKLKQLCKFASSFDEDVKVRGVVDTAPILEREFAELAGIGWRAKNTMVINRDIGSWFFLAVLLINKPLVYDSAFEVDHCGTCTACLDACPTNAFPEPRVLDATKCISYLTIEHRSPIPLELRPQMGDWILGCDICQDVCPWNNKAARSEGSTFMPTDDQNPMDLIGLFDLDDEEFRARFRKTPLWRPKRRGILRNAAIALGNSCCQEAIPALGKGLNDEEPLIRGASAWALGRFDSARSIALLSSRQTIETDADVLEEIKFALAELEGGSPIN